MDTLESFSSVFEFMGYRLASPEALFLLALLAICLFFAFRRRNPTVRLPSVKAVQACPGGSFWIFIHNRIPLMFCAVGLLLLIFALSRPQKGLETVKQRAEGVDMMMVLDLSGSMKAIDIPSDVTAAQVKSGLREKKLRQRIDVAKAEIAHFVEKRPNDRIGLVVFANQPYVACPPTLDHAWLFSHLQSVDAGVIGDATGIASPLASAVSRLKDSPSKRRVAVLFTDGKNNMQARISPLQSAKLAKDCGVVIYTVGIGSKNAIVEQSGPFGSQFIALQDEFDEALLSEIAKETSGKYFKAADAKGLETVMNEINSLEKTSAEQKIHVDYREFCQPIMLMALAFLFGGFTLGKTFLLTLP